MQPYPTLPLPAALETAVQRLKRAARDAAQQTVESLGLAALSAQQAHQREQLLSAQFELNRKLSSFGLGFNDALDERLVRELGQRVRLHPPSGAEDDSLWDSLRLVDDGEVEAQIAADRFAMDIAHSCEWELREIEAYLGSVLPDSAAGPRANPLRPELLGHALVKAIQPLSERPELRKLLVKEIGRSLAGVLRASYAAIVADWRQSGLHPASLSVRRRQQREGELEGATDTSRGPFSDRPSTGESGRAGLSTQSPADPTLRGHTASIVAGRAERAPAHTRTAGHGRELGSIDPGLMSLIRRLAYSAVPVTGGNGAGAAGPGAEPGLPTAQTAGEKSARLHGDPPSRSTPLEAGADPGWDGEAPGNLIHAHREELRQAASGALDHMVIDVIGFLFDQILSDPKVPPQMARLLARLQLPVLRAALGDASFFASRRHPVRRFVNRMATLSAAFDDIHSAEAQAFLAKAGELVKDVVEGDFEQINLYEEKLAALEAFVQQQQADSLDSAGQEAAALVSQKEDELRLQQLYAERLAGDLRSVQAPLFVLDFLSTVWSQVLLAAQAQDARSTPPGQRAAKLRPVARELVLSVQPKATPAQRKELLSELPRLMLALTEGMDLVAWPAEARRHFFGQLMPAHAEALKATASRQLDINLTLRQVDSALSRPPPTRGDLVGGAAVPVLRDVMVPVKFSAEEARRIGLVDENAVQWDGLLDINVDELQAAAEPPPAALPGMPEWAVENEPLTGRELAEQVQIGFAYQMHLQGDWHKVRLSHVSAGRSFFIFTRGTRHQQTISLTYRMLLRLCEAHRFRAIETNTLLERATVRARQQLSDLAARTRAAQTPGRLH